jgi:hypothetical protein
MLKLYMAHPRFADDIAVLGDERHKPNRTLKSYGIPLSKISDHRFKTVAVCLIERAIHRVFLEKLSEVLKRPGVCYRWVSIYLLGDPCREHLCVCLKMLEEKIVSEPSIEWETLLVISDGAHFRCPQL